MLHYIIQTICFQLIFLMVYDLFLKKETFFNYNRVYLLVTAVLSFILPFIKINSFKTLVPEDYIVRLPEVIIGSISTNSFNEQMINTLPNAVETTSSFQWSWSLVLILGMVVTGFIFMFKTAKLVWLVNKNPKRWKGDLLIIRLMNSSAAFSFFHYVFLGEKLQPEEASTILNHERVHVKEKHTIDLLFFECVRIIFWFNPLVYIYQNRIRALHEYIADDKAIKAEGKTKYYQNLLTQIFETKDLSFVNTFYKKSLLKKRVIMLSQTKSKQIHLIKYVMLLPMVFTMLLYTSTYAQEKVTDVQKEYQELTDKQLEEKYYNEIVKLEKEGGNVYSVFENYLASDQNKYILSREQLFKQKAYMRYVLKYVKEKQIQDGTYDKEKDPTLRTPKYETYQEYLDYKKTDEAKRAWDNQTKNGVLRLVVDDLGNLTDDEQKRFDKKMKMIENDDYFNSLMMTDGKGTTKMVVQEIDNKKIPVPENSNSNDIEIVETEEQLEVPFGVIENVPTFEFCKDLKTNEERKKCMSQNVAKHVNKNFNTDLAKSLGLVGRQRISVLFKIDKVGYVTGIRARAPHPALEDEAKRVIATLPQFIPGTQKGEPVIVPYSLPIVFQVTEDKSQESNTLPFSKIDEPPVFIAACLEIDNKEQQRKCTAQALAKFVNKKFNMKVAEDSNLKGVQKIVTTFKINKQGVANEVKVKAPNKALEEETKRVMYSLPRFKPGKHKGELVEVLYSLPIQFYIAE
ncbi:M56 family metallopeptidase [Ichthyenterobacterium sp. W332]|uniref:M56 family metallopeptidase n=1 Tax=Microcosmobacter mediterraneus TaxID=3075607 RepID=A0ABU2YPH9_9FLAO|nr:M56 family metallopeptidase [Ichthyenterobacterium sp. W332]MDT0558958.1 M56 family metallopeptidase [Ichthyenterobacterium sp. W332]